MDKVMMLKVNFEEVDNELRFAKHPMVNWTMFINMLIEHYKHFTNCRWGWVLYDWLSERGYLKGISFIPPGKTNEEKSLVMDRLISQKVLNLEQIQSTIKK